MKITSLHVEGAGRFSTPVSVTGFGDGVNVLCEHNEVGKSTLFRALRACLFERHGAKNDALRRLATDGSALPLTVMLGFEHEGRSYELRKSFLRSAAASLRRDGVEIARGGTADEQVWDILGIAPGSGRSVDQAAFGLLWVAQGQSFGLPEPSEAAAGALNEAIQAEVGALVGGERARTLLAEVKREIALFVTETGRPKAGGELEKAASRVAELERELSDSERRLAEVDAQINALTQSRRDRDEAMDPVQAAAMAAELATAEAALAEGRAANQKLQLAEAEERDRRNKAETARRLLDELDGRAARIDEARAQDGALEERAKACALREQEQAHLLAEVQAELAAAAEAEQRGASALRICRGLRAAIAAVTARAGAAERLAALAERSDRLRHLEAELATLRADDAALTKFDALQRELDGLAARLDAGSARVTVEVLPAGKGRVTLGGGDIEGLVSQAVSGPVEIAVGDFARITALPPSAFGAAETARVDVVKREAAAILAACDVGSAGALRRQNDRRREILSERAGILGGLAGLGIKADDLAGELERLATATARHDETVHAALATAGRDALPNVAELDHEEAEAEAQVEEAAKRRARLDGRRTGINAAVQALAGERGVMEGERRANDRLLQADLAALPDDLRAAARAEAAANWANAERDAMLAAAALAERRMHAPDAAELERLENRAVRLKSAMETQKAKAAALDREIANLEGRIQNAGAEGLGEKVAASRDELELRRREEAKFRHRVDMLRMLHDTVAACHQEQRDQLNAPLKRHLQPYLADLFATADLDLGDGFNVNGLRRVGPAHERFELLSEGTKEQIAVLTRLAMGSMLAERGKAVPIVLDDALVFSDDERIERMFDALGRAGRRQQVIVFTCRTRTFARIGGTRLTLETPQAAG